MATAKRKKKPAARGAGSDFGPKESHQRGAIVIDRVVGEGTTEVRDRARRNMTLPLEYYRGRNIITDTQYFAGSTLRALHDEAHISASSEITEYIGKGSVEIAYDHKRKIVQAYNAALWWVGPRYAYVVRTACIDEEYLPSPVDRKKLALGLDKLNNWLERGSPRRTRVDMSMSE